MCTLAIAFRVFTDTPIAVAANRDERLDRLSHPPRTLEGSPSVIAPRDERAGGTWIGYNEHDLFVAITNRWTDADLVGERSRGLLVRDALAQADVDSAVATVEAALADHEYEGFNLLIVDPETAVVLEWDGALRVTPLEPGLHVIMNTGFDDQFEVPNELTEAGNRQVAAARKVKKSLEPRTVETAADWLDRAAAVLGDHDIGVCIHGDGYGTRSSSLVAISPNGSDTYRFADGPPCETPFERVKAQF